MYNLVARYSKSKAAVAPKFAMSSYNHSGIHSGSALYILSSIYFQREFRKSFNSSFNSYPYASPNSYIFDPYKCNKYIVLFQAGSPIT